MPVIRESSVEVIAEEKRREQFCAGRHFLSAQ